MRGHVLPSRAAKEQSMAAARLCDGGWVRRQRGAVAGALGGRVRARTSCLDMLGLAASRAAGAAGRDEVVSGCLATGDGVLN